MSTGINNLETFSSPLSKTTDNSYRVGKVYAVTLNKETPSNFVYQTYGVGSIVFMDYESSKNIDIYLGDIKNPNESNIAIPLFPNQKYYPVIGELVLILDLPNTSTQINGTSTQKYYICIINIWKNIHHNSQLTSNNVLLGKTFEEKSNIKSLQPYEGDYIIEGRFQNSIRLGSTSKDVNVPNPWSSIGNSGDPIITISNRINNNTSSLHTENINDDDSSVYLTSSQIIPIIINKNIINPLYNLIKFDKYTQSQIILNSDRIIINSKKNSTIISGFENVSIISKNNINIDSDNNILINSPKTYLGLNDNQLPTDPMLLGTKTVEWMLELLSILLNYTKLISTSKDSLNQPIQANKVGFDYFNSKLEGLSKNLEKISSTKNFVS